MLPVKFPTLKEFFKMESEEFHDLPKSDDVTKMDSFKEDLKNIERAGMWS